MLVLLRSHPEDGSPSPPDPRWGFFSATSIGGIGGDFMRPSMTRECEERMWNLAYRLAQSGEHQNYQAIEWELQASGFPRAHQLLDHERVRENLDGMCAQARKGFVSA
jgi:hypothetical protein